MAGNACKGCASVGTPSVHCLRLLYSASFLLMFFLYLKNCKYITVNFQCATFFCAWPAVVYSQPVNASREEHVLAYITRFSLSITFYQSSLSQLNVLHYVWFYSALRRNPKFWLTPESHTCKTDLKDLS